MKIDKAYFGAVMKNFNCTDYETVNIFDFRSVKWSVAHYIVYPERRQGDWLAQCFLDLQGKCEFEYLLMDVTGHGEPKKVDLWTMYIVPNRDILHDLVHSISVSSAKEYLKSERARLRSARSTK